MEAVPDPDTVVALRRVRAISAAAATVEVLKLLPGIDAAVLAVEWGLLKGALPMALELSDRLRAGERRPQALWAGFRSGNWFSLIHRAFGAAGGASALAIDGITDLETLLLPAPFDGFDAPAAIADAAICYAAHRRLAAAAAHQVRPRPEAGGRLPLAR